jgi:cellulose synthase/poly-beta-1,6-N-acetylglucosamine synthase-like glycosyltransferase
MYWKYETFLKRCEGRLGGLLGANGAIYAIRRNLYQQIPSNTIVDDFVIPLLARLRTGCRIVYDYDAVAREETAASVGAEFDRRARIGAGGFRSIGLLWRLLDPRRGWVSLTFLSHKILRWFCPFFMLGALLSSVLLWHDPIHRLLLGGQSLFYSAALVTTLAPDRVRLPKPLRLAAMFVSMNGALLIGFVRWAKGNQSGMWRRTSRTTEALSG